MDIEENFLEDSFPGVAYVDHASCSNRELATSACNNNYFVLKMEFGASRNLHRFCASNYIIKSSVRLVLAAISQRMAILTQMHLPLYFSMPTRNPVAFQILQHAYYAVI